MYMVLMKTRHLQVDNIYKTDVFFVLLTINEQI